MTSATMVAQTTRRLNTAITQNSLVDTRSNAGAIRVDIPFGVLESMDTLSDERITCCHRHHEIVPCLA